MNRLELAVRKKAKAPYAAAWVRHVVETALTIADRAVKSQMSNAKGPISLSVSFVADAEMRRLNRKWRGKDRTTDVLSFEGGMGDLGDIVISVPQARKQAREAGRSERAETAMLLVHGTLHLLGYDHERPKDAAVMLPLQAKALEKLGYGA